MKITAAPTIFNIENLSHSSRPKITDVHIPTSTQINAIRQRCHNHAYLTIKGFNEYNNQVSASEKILEEDLEAAKIGNWFTDNLINSCLSEIISHNEHTIESSHYYDEYIVRGHHNRNS